MSKRKYMIIILAIILGTIALIFVLQQSLTSTPRTIAIGESIKYGKEERLLITFTGEKLTETLEARNPEEGRVFCIINMTFKNIGNKDLSYGDLSLPINPNAYFAIRGAVLIVDGYEFNDYGSKTSIYEIKINETIDTYIYFEIPSNLQPSELKIYHVDKVEWILKL